MKKKLQLNWRSLPVQISLYFLLMMTLLLAFYGISTYYTSAAIILAKTEEETVEGLQRSGEYVNDYVKRLKKVTAVIATSSTTQTFIETDSKESRQQVMTLIDNLLAADEYLVSAVLITRDGRLISNEVDLEMPTSTNMMAEEWYQLAISQDGMAILSSARKQALANNEESWVISVTQEIVDEIGTNLGVIRMDIDYQGMANYLNRLNLGKGGYAFILNDRQQIVYHQDITVFSDHVLQSQIRIDSQRPTGYDRRAEQLVYRQTIPETNWQLIGVASLEELTMVSQNMQLMLLLVGGLMLIVVFLGSLLVIRGLTKPIRVLEDSMSHVVSGLSAARVVETGSDEIRSLARSFNFMLTEMEGLVKDGQVKEEAIHQFELQTLASQINPHFLYNTLETIIWMAEFNDGQKVVEITKSLASFFRLSLNQGNEMIHLQDEIAQVRHYLFIQKQRYGEQLSYNVIEDTALNEYLLPKLVIQPIVENAIYHGIKESPRLGLITIQTRADQEFLYIDIRDNGRGYQQKQPVQTSKTKLGGIGLANIDERLRLQYGADYQMVVASQPDEYTLITLKLPLQAKS